MEGHPSAQLEVVIDDDALYRRLAPGWINDDGTVNSAAYKLNGKPANRFSVDLARLTTPEATASGRPGFGVGQFYARDVRVLEFEVWHDPEDGNDAHCTVDGTNDRIKCRALAKQTTVLLFPQPNTL